MNAPAPKSLLIPQARKGLGLITTWDLGTNSGWCDVDESGTLRSGHLHYPTKTYPSRGKQYLAFRADLIRYRRALADQGQTIIKAYYEIVQFQADNGLLTAQFWGGMEAIFTSFWESHGVSAVGVPVTTLKQAATGHGDAPKDEKQRQAMNERRVARKRPVAPYTGPTVQGALTALGLTFESGDEADAIGLMIHALNEERQEMQNAPR